MLVLTEGNGTVNIISVNYCKRILGLFALKVYIIFRFQTLLYVVLIASLNHKLL